MRLFRVLTIGLCGLELVTCSCSAPPALDGPPARIVKSNAYLLLSVTLTPKLTTVIDARKISLKMPVARSPETGPWRVDVEDNQGSTLYTAFMQPANLLRVELPRPDGSYESFTRKLAEATVSVRLPLVVGQGRVRFFGKAETLEADDARVAGTASGDFVELGEVSYPELKP